MTTSTPKPLTFKATIEDAGGGGAYVTVPYDLEKKFGSKRPKIVATFDGVEYRGTAVRMGSEHHLVIILKGIREKIGKGMGDDVKVTLRPDTEPRIIEVPDDLRDALGASKRAQETFDGLAYTHRREYVEWITSARKEETRARRIGKTVEMLEEKAEVKGRKSRIKG